MFTGRARWVLVGAVLAVVAASLAGCADDPSDVPVAVTEAAVTTVPASDELDRLQVVDHRGTTQVDVTALDNVFVDAAIRIDVGATVTWRNEGRAVHTIDMGGETGAADDVVSTKLPLGGEHAVTFDEPGTYAYFCELHGTAAR